MPNYKFRACGCSICYKCETQDDYPVGESVDGVHACADFQFETLFGTNIGPISFALVAPDKSERLTEWVAGVLLEPDARGQQDYIWAVTIPASETEKLLENGEFKPSLNVGSTMTPRYEVCVRAMIDGDSTPIDFKTNLQKALL